MNTDRLLFQWPHALAAIVVPFLFFLLIGGCGHQGSHTIVPSSSPAVLAAPVSVVAIAGNGSATLSWSSVAGTTGYRVYRSTTDPPANAIVSTETTTYVDSGLVNGTTYYYAVTALDGGNESAPSDAVAVSPGAAGTSFVTINGTIQYEDKEYGIDGFTGNLPDKAVRYATVELVSATTGSVLATAATDSIGGFALATNPGPAGAYVRVDAEATIPGSPVSPQAMVKDHAGALYAMRSADFTTSGPATIALTVPASSIGGVFNILDVLLNGLAFDHHFSGGTYPVSPVVAYWQANTCEGTYFDGTDIYVMNDPNGTVCGGGPDTDEYDDDVLYHEFGHYTTALYSIYDTPGGVHYVTDNDLDLRLSFSEGWGDAMPGAIKRWLVDSGQQDLLSSAPGTPLTEYVDTYGNTAFAMDMDDPGGAPYRYAGNEVAVAKILLDLGATCTEQDVWNVIADFKAHRPTTPVNLELFWDRWLAVNPADTVSALATSFAGRSVLYTADTNTTPAAAATIVTDASTTGSLYPAGNADYWSLSAVAGKAYTIGTSNLKNGADTFVKIFTPGQALLGSDDNANDVVYSGTTLTTRYPSRPSDIDAGICDAYGSCHENGYDILSSRLTFTAPASGTYLISVQSSTSPPISAGRYGTYTLTVH